MGVHLVRLPIIADDLDRVTAKARV